MTTVATTNPQEAKIAPNPQDAKQAENPQEVLASGGQALPRPEYNGHLLAVEGNPAIYLVLNGYLRLVPDWDTFLRLFHNAPIEPVGTLVNFSKGPALTNRTMLIRGDEVNKTYLLVDKVKMWIPNPTIFEQYHFDMAQCCILPQFVVDLITTGPNVEGPHK